MPWVDRYRVFPRIVLILYILAVGLTLEWYIDFDIKYQSLCNAPTLEILLDRGVPIKDAERIACTVVSAVGRPNGYTALMSVLVGAGAGIFGFYVTSGVATRKEDK